ncbi:hypothetical protein C8Q75DRAFT_763783 [Abortiporus biennis]|nr:hypothetical protein C8Q75DRAFT_763783 [Abortiporus biennis]
MSPATLSTLLAVAAASTVAVAQTTTAAFTPLADKHFAYPSQIPYQVDPDNGVRGSQFGYNICNSTTENQNSLCQTAFVNHLDDWCVWAPSKPNSTIGDTEGEEVAWCTKPGRGTRLIPAGALTAVKMVRTEGYIQVTGLLDQTQININTDDTGGELDPHGADLRGNPMGGIVYSNGFASNNGNNDTFQQVIEWHNFMGSNSFCMKVCDPAGPNAASLCQHIYDRIGVMYNCPMVTDPGVFQVCDGENQDPPGIYTLNGQVMTYSQPPESLGAIQTMPYQPRIPATSNCVTFQSQALFTALPTPTAAAATTAATSAPSGSSGTATKSGSSGSTASRTSSGSPTATGGSSSGAASMQVSAFFTVISAVVAVAFLS